MTIYIDKSGDYYNHDRSYYGNGCSGGDGSITPCTSRIVKTNDNEDQKNGTYYNSQSATSGTGGSMSTDNANSSDTFCPLGWQMPYSGTGGDYYDKSRSWNNLFTTYSISFDDGASVDATKLKSYPFSYIASGYFYFFTGKLYVQGNHGLYWSSIIKNINDAYALYVWNAGIRPNNMTNKSNAFVIRCV